MASTDGGCSFPGDLLLKPIVEVAGQDISHWFDPKTRDVSSSGNGLKGGGAGGLKRKLLLGILRTERRPLGPISSTVSSSLLEWLDLGQGVPSACEAYLAPENQEGPGWGPEKESQTLVTQARF